MEPAIYPNFGSKIYADSLNKFLKLSVAFTVHFGKRYEF